MSANSSPRVGSSKIQIFRDSTATHSLNDLDSEWELTPEDDSVRTDSPSILSHPSSCPEISCFPSTFYRSSRNSISCSTSPTSSSRIPTPPSFLVHPPQTPPGPHATSFQAMPSPLCLGPSLCHTNPDNREDVCLDKPRDDDGNKGLRLPTDSPTRTSRPHHLLSQSLPPSRISSPPLPPSPSRLLTKSKTIESHVHNAPRSSNNNPRSRSRAMTLPTHSTVPDFQAGDLFIPSFTGKVHHPLHRKKSRSDLRDEFWRSSTRRGTR